jgi:transposase
MQKQASQIIAVDISKETLEVLSEKRSFSVANDKEGLRELTEHARSFQAPVTVFEATGGYERKLIEALASKALRFARLNPARIRNFAKSEGVKAKTDPIDARMILRFAQQKDIRLEGKADPKRQKIADLLDRRSHLTSTLTQEKNRLQNSPDAIHRSIKRIAKALERELESIEKQIRKLVESDSALHEQAKVAQSVVGVGEITAWTILCCLSEIQSLPRNKIVALAGVAPYNDDSGKARKKRRIQEGRAKVRKCLYMATKTAAVHNPVIKEYVKGLRERGKPYNCAIVAGMRKLLLHLQSLLKKHALALAS